MYAHSKIIFELVVMQRIQRIMIVCFCSNLNLLRNHNLFTIICINQPKYFFRMCEYRNRTVRFCINNTNCPLIARSTVLTLGILEKKKKKLTDAILKE